jgi:hypothetical protein
MEDDMKVILSLVCILALVTLIACGNENGFSGGTYETDIGKLRLENGKVFVEGEELGTYEYADGEVTLNVGGASDTFIVDENGDLLHDTGYSKEVHGKKIN